MTTTASPTKRRVSLFGADERIVLDLGSRVVRIGLSGDAEPRVLMDATALAEQVLQRPIACLWDLDYQRTESTSLMQRRQADLVMGLTRILRVMYQDYLLTDPKLHRVLIVKSPIGIDAVQQALCHVLLENIRVPSVSFINTHVLCTLAAGRTAALVVDVGYLETCVMPVFDGRPLTHLITTTPRAGRFLSEKLTLLLRAYAKLSAAGETLLTPSHVEKIKTQTLFVGEPCDAPTFSTVTPWDTHAFAKAYSTHSTASAWTFTTHDGAVHVPGWIRERACEVLWEHGDEDEMSIAECIVHVIRRLPMDLRRPLVSSIILAGGTSMLPHFRERCEKAVQKALPSALSPQILNGTHTWVANNVLAWTGGSMAGHYQADGTQILSRDGRAANRSTSFAAHDRDTLGREMGHLKTPKDIHLA